MSDANRTRYEVQKILADSIKSALSSYVGSDHGFEVMEFAQASFQKADKVCLLNLIRTKRLGWQSVKNPVVNDELKRRDEWIECQHWQIHVILKKSDSPTVDTMQADDFANILISWFNGKGCDELRKYGVANERVDPSQLIVYVDDSELYQKRAVFTVRLQVPKELTMGEIEMDTVVPKIKPV